MVCISNTSVWERKGGSLLHASGCVFGATAIVSMNLKRQPSKQAVLQEEGNASTFLHKVKSLCPNSTLQVWCKTHNSRTSFLSLRPFCSLPTVGDDVCLREWLMNLLLVQRCFLEAGLNLWSSIYASTGLYESTEAEREPALNGWCDGCSSSSSTLGRSLGRLLGGTAASQGHLD